MNTKLLFISAVVGLAIAGSFMVFQSVEKKQKPETKTLETIKKITTSPLEPVSQAAFYLAKPGGDRVYSVTEKIELLVVADSVGKDVVGYDAVLEVPSNLKVQTRAQYTGFKTVVDQKDSRITITGIKDLESNVPSILQNNAIATFTITPQSTGTFPISFMFEPGKTNDSNIMDSQAKDILGKVTGTTIIVGESLNLRLNKAITIDKGITTVRLKETEVPEKNCADCITHATIDVERDGKIESLVFKFGGIAGFMTETESAHGYTFSVSDITKNSVRLLYKVD